MREYLNTTVLGMCQCNAATVESTRAVDYLDFIALDEPKHSHAMARLFLGKSERSGYIGGEESMHFINSKFTMHNAQLGCALINALLANYQVKQFSV